MRFAVFTVSDIIPVDKTVKLKVYPLIRNIKRQITFPDLFLNSFGNKPGIIWISENISEHLGKHSSELGIGIHLKNLISRITALINWSENSSWRYRSFKTSVSKIIVFFFVRKQFLRKRSELFGIFSAFIPQCPVSILEHAVNKASEWIDLNLCIILSLIDPQLFFEHELESALSEVLYRWNARIDNFSFCPVRLYGGNEPGHYIFGDLRCLAVMPELNGFSGDRILKCVDQMEFRLYIIFKIFKNAALGLSVLMDHIDNVACRT